MKLKFSSITEIGLYVSNLEESLCFYTKILNFELEKKFTNNGYYLLKLDNIYLSLKKGGVKVKGIKNKGESPLLLRFYLASRQELEQFSIYLEKNNIILNENITDYSFGSLLNFSDPDGNKLEVLLRDI